jgi:hypothetical protein
MFTLALVLDRRDVTAAVPLTGLCSLLDSNAQRVLRSSLSTFVFSLVLGSKMPEKQRG